jgi:hypothetical protein
MMKMYSYTIHRLTTGGSCSVVTTIKTKGPLTPSEALARIRPYVVSGVAVLVTDDSGQSEWPPARNGGRSAVASFYDEDSDFFDYLDEGPINL